MLGGLRGWHLAAGFLALAGVMHLTRESLAPRPPHTEIDGILFDSRVRLGSITLSLVGGGTRHKLGGGKVYAVGAYVHERSARKALKTFAKTPAADLRHDQRFFDELTSGNFHKALVLIFHRSVSASALAEELCKALAVYLPEDNIGVFRERLLEVVGARIETDSHVLFSCRQDKQYIAFKGGDRVQSLHDMDQMCKALLDVYLGKHPLSPAIKDGVADGFVEVYMS